MNRQRDPGRIHALLDEETSAPARTPEETATLAKYRSALGRLEKGRVQAPDNLTADILAALRASRRPTIREWMEGLLPEGRHWAVPAFAGALAMLMAVVGAWHLFPRTQAQQVLVHFQIHAPGAHCVELVGDFNNWTPGAIKLQGPDASGHWTANVELPEGHYEYQFLVDGKTWVTDPNARVHRPDGFGRDNAIVDVYEERS